MWLSRLDLLAFGRFSNVSLKLGPGFHLVYGPNEAGKSTTLRAIRQLLFGFDERTSDNFVHANPDLRIGGVVCDDAGAVLEIIRRKSRKDSLRAADDTAVIDDKALQDRLCGVDEATFSLRYGIDYEQLTEGGKEIATGSGDLGEILFATGSGVMDLTAIQKRLNEEAAEIFRPQGKKQRLNQALTELQLQREIVIKKLLPVADWEEADRLQQEIQSRLDQVTKEWTLRATERERLLRFQQAWPLIHEQFRLDQQLKPFASTPRLPATFGANRQEAFLLFKQAKSQDSTATQALEQARKQLAKLAIPAGFLERSEEFAALMTEWGSYRKAQLDRPRLQQQFEKLQGELASLSQTLGRSLDAMPLEDVVLDRALRTRISQLGRQQAGLVQASQQAESRRDRLAKQMDEAKKRATGAPVSLALDELRNAVRTIRTEGDLELQLTKLQSEIAALQAESDGQRRRLAPWTGTTEGLQSMRVPAPAIIERSLADLDASQTEQVMHRARLTELEEERQHLIRQIEELRQQFQVPTEEELTVARKKRDEIWSQIRQRTTAKKGAPVDLIEAFEQSMTEADLLSDRLRHEADRVAQLADQLTDCQTNESRQHEISLRVAELEASRLAMQQRWNAEWPDLQENLLSPREMQTWLVRRETLLQNERLICRRQTDAEELVNRIRSHIESLSKLMVGELCHSESLTERLTQAETQIEQDNQIRLARKEADENLSRLLLEQTEATEQVQRSAGEQALWQKAWQAEMAEIKLDLNSSPEIADTHLQSLSELVDLRKQIQQLQERIKGIDADAERFLANIAIICQQLAPDLIELEIHEQMTSLRTRLAACQRDQVTFNDQTSRKIHAEEQLEAAQRSRIRGLELVDNLCRDAGLDPLSGDPTSAISDQVLEEIFEQLGRIEEQSQKRVQIDGELKQVHDRLLELSGDQPVADFIAEVQQAALEAVNQTVQELDRELTRLNTERDRLNQQLGGVNHRLQQMDGSADAAEAEENQRQSLAQIRADAERYIRVKLAGSVLHTAIERYRDKIRGPVLTVAGELFRELTLQSFEGLRVDEDDRSNPVLVGLRAGSRQAVTVNGMSEGTCDQLYLALRLASLQLESAPRSHLPFIVDDILIQFDDLRAAAALRILCKLGQQRQVIFFTHHQHLLDVAARHLSVGYSSHQLECATT